MKYIELTALIFVSIVTLSMMVYMLLDIGKEVIKPKRKRKGKTSKKQDRSKLRAVK